AIIAILFQSDRQNNLACRLSPLKRPVSIRSVSQREGRPDAEVEPAVFDAVEQHRRTLRQFLRRTHEPCQRWTRQEDSARGIQALDVERRHLTRGPAEEHHRAEWLDRGQRGIKRVLADTVIGDIDTLTVGELPDLRRDVDALTVEEHLIGPGLARQLRLL